MPTEREKMCLWKRRYDSKAVARAFAEEIGTRRGLTLRVYRCPYCQLWHLTHTEFDPERDKGRSRRSLWSTA